MNHSAIEILQSWIDADATTEDAPVMDPDPTFVATFFKLSGTYYTTETITWDLALVSMFRSYDHKGMLRACIDKQNGTRLREMVVVVMEYPHEHTHPQMLYPPSIARRTQAFDG